jgi:AraC family transcriptional regulator
MHDRHRLSHCLRATTTHPRRRRSAALVMRGALPAPVQLPNLVVEVRNFSWDERESVVLRRPAYQIARQIGGSQATSRCRYKQDASKPLANLAFVPADTAVPLELTPGKATFVLCEFERTYFERLISVNEWPDELTAALVNTRNEFLETMLDRVAHELLREEGPRSQVLEALTTLIGIEAADTIQRAKSALRPGKLCYSEIERLCQVIDEAPHGRETRLGHLAQRFAISPRHLSRSFKAATGTTIHSYMQRARINRAKELLREDQLSLKEIAHVLGFSDASHLSAEFRRQVGFPPSEYRVRVAENVQPF